MFPMINDIVVSKNDFTSRADLDSSPSPTESMFRNVVLTRTGRVSLDKVQRMATSSIRMMGPCPGTMWSQPAWCVWEMVGVVMEEATVMDIVLLVDSLVSHSRTCFVIFS